MIEERERRDIRMAILYELSLFLNQCENNEYTKEEIVEIIDKIEFV